VPFIQSSFIAELKRVINLVFSPDLATLRNAFSPSQDFRHAPLLGIYFSASQRFLISFYIKNIAHTSRFV
jgi:hypothetical protein